MTLDLPPEAAALRDRAIAPAMAAVEAALIGAALEQVAIDHARSLHPSSFVDPTEVAADMDQIAAGETSFPEPGDELLIHEIPCSVYIRLAGEDVIFLGHRGDVLDGIDANGIGFEYHATEGERFHFVSDLL